MNRTFAALLISGLGTGLTTGLATAQTSSPAPQVKKADPASEKTAAKTAEIKPADKSLAELFPEQPGQEESGLTLGSKAPELEIAQWIRGDAISGFVPGHTYVVEFWATWCGPCIVAFPHLADLQKKYEGDLTVIGVNIWEQASGDDRVKLVNDFVANHEEMVYTVALEEGTAMAENWMRAAGRNGIPSAFIVNGEGRVAWMGHPMAMDEPLDEIIAGKYDLDAARLAIRTEQLTMTAMNELREKAAAGAWDRINDIAKALMHESFAKNPDGLNAVSWFIVSSEKTIPEETLKIALKAGKMANDQTDWKDWSALDTYALAAFKNGQKAEAIKWQNKAIELAPPQAQPELKERLETFNAEG